MKKGQTSDKIIKEMQYLLELELKHFRSFYSISLQQKRILNQFNEKNVSITTSLKKKGNGEVNKSSAHSLKISEIEKLLSGKDSIIFQIKECEKRIELLLKSDSSLKLLIEDNNTIKSLKQQMTEAISKIMPVEKETTELLKKKEKYFKKNIGTLRKGRTVIAGYGRNKFQIPRFIDYKLQ